MSTLRNTTITTQLSTKDIPYGYSGVIPVRSFNPTSLTHEFGQIFNAYQSRNDIRLNATGCRGVCHTRVVAPGFDERCTEGTTPYNLTFQVNPGGGGFTSTEENIGSIIFSRETAAEFNASVKYKDDSACIGVLHTVDCSFRLATVSYPITIANNTASLRPGGANDSLSISPVRYEGGSIADQFSTAGGFYLVADQLFGSNITLQARLPYWSVQGNGSMRYTYQSNGMYNNCSITYSNPMPDIRSALRELIFRASIGLSNSSTLQITPGTEEVGRVIYRLNPYYLLASLCVMLTNVVAVLPLYFGWWHLGRVVSMSPLETAKAFRSPLMADAGSNEELGGLVRAVGEKRVRYGAVVAQGGALEQSDCQRDDAQRFSADGGEAVVQHIVDHQELGARSSSGAEAIPLKAFEEDESVGGGDRLILCLTEEKDGLPPPPGRGNLYF
ncbi:hypothetical protein DIS24_g8847 [Lasiodiplodia hormozganensis]|uniref:Uncharacterized protein n=1 Tax=Lasiodiplodia hormozganensis TaxID=869390 RepID=A0AA39XZF3_9PEZI|nr:hypothetical protein DIS24_g8847 [Lasiodiplodia hormozganensis]